jgi:hypothetical protein
MSTHGTEKLKILIILNFFTIYCVEIAGSALNVVFARMLAKCGV